MEIKKPTILISYEDNDQYTSVDCLHKYFEYLDKFEKKCSSFNENNCAHICNECNELNKNIYNLKRECHNQISPFAHLHKENEEINFCEKCTSECKYSKKTRCCNEGNIALKSDADQLCEGNNVSKDETVTIDEGSMLQTILDSQVSDPRSSESDNHGKQGEKHNAESEFKSEKENPEKQQETGTDNFEKNQEEVSSPMDDNRTTTPVKLQTTPECLSALSNSLNNTLTTNENNESSEKNLAQLSNSGITHQGNDSNKDITQSIIQVPQSNAQHISLKKNHNAVKEISYIITFVYKTFFSIVLSNIPFIKYVSHHVGANTSQGTPESSSSMCDGSQDTDNPSPDKEVPKGKSSSHFHTSHGNSGVEHAITDINIHISNTEEGTPDQRTHDNGTNEGVIPISALFDEMLGRDNVLSVTGSVEITDITDNGVLQNESIENGDRIPYKKYTMMALVLLSIILFLIILTKYTPLGMVFTEKKKLKKKRKQMNEKLQRVLFRPSVAKERSVQFAYNDFEY